MRKKNPRLIGYDEKIGGRLRGFRGKMTMVEVSKKLTNKGFPCDKNKLHNIEKGHVPFHYHTFVIRICQIYNKTPNDIYGVRIVRDPY